MPIKTTNTTSAAIFHCSLERAFKTPILGDATKTLTGYSVIPPVTHFTEDKTWGKVGGSRIPHSVSNFFSKGGEVGFDVILAREENKYWKWQLKEFRQWSMGFTKFQGELFFDLIENNTVKVTWVYTLYSASLFWLYAG